MSISYPYRSKPMTMALGALFFGVCSAFFAHKVATNDRGLIINGVIELGPTGATAFYAALGIASIAFVVIAIVSTLHGHFKRPALVLSDDHMIVPFGLLRKRVRTIRFAGIRKIAIQEVSGQRFLTIWSADGKVSIAKGMLESEAAFAEVCIYVRDRAPESAWK